MTEKKERKSDQLATKMQELAKLIGELRDEQAIDIMDDAYSKLLDRWQELFDAGD